MINQSWSHKQRHQGTDEGTYQKKLNSFPGISSHRLLLHFTLESQWKKYANKVSRNYLDIKDQTSFSPFPIQDCTHWTTDLHASPPSCFKISIFTLHRSNFSRTGETLPTQMNRKGWISSEDKPGQNHYYRNFLTQEKTNSMDISLLE